MTYWTGFLVASAGDKTTKERGICRDAIEFISLLSRESLSLSLLTTTYETATSVRARRPRKKIHDSGQHERLAQTNVDD
jgi:hypothetical protein